MKRPAEAERQLRRVLEAHPTDASSLTALANALFRLKRHSEAIDTYRQAIAANPKYVEAYRQLKETCLTLRRWEEGRTAWQEWLACDDRTFLVIAGSGKSKSAWQNWLRVTPSEDSAWDGYAELCLYLGNETEYCRSRKELLKRFANTTDPQIAERTGRACLLLPATDEELNQATALVNRALTADSGKYGWAMPYFRFAKALAEYRAGQLMKALAFLQGDTLRVLQPAPSLLLAMVQQRLGQADAARKTFNAAVAGYNWDPAKVSNRESWMYHVLRREAEAVLASKP